MKTYRIKNVCDVTNLMDYAEFQNKVDEAILQWEQQNPDLFVISSKLEFSVTSEKFSDEIWVNVVVDYDTNYQL